MKAPQRKGPCRSQASSVDPVSLPAMSTTGIKPEFKTKPEMKSLIVKRSVVLGGHKTSVSLEDAFWKSLKEIAASGKMTVSELLTAIDSGWHHGNLSSAIRLFVLNFYREQLLHRLDRGPEVPSVGTPFIPKPPRPDLLPEWN